jgi:protein ImuA
MIASQKTDLIAQLQKDILLMQGLRDDTDNKARLGLGVIEQAFPNKSFPVAAVHEFMSYGREQAAATNSFLTCLLSKLMQKNGYCIWVSKRRTIYAPALKRFGIDADRILFIEAGKNIEALWAIEEALKCDKITAVVGEVPDLSFTESRRLQLAVESSKVTGLIHRCYPRQENTVACVSRWYIKPVSSQTEDNMPGVGFPKWEVTLSKIRNGHPGTWMVEWIANNFAISTMGEASKVITFQTGMHG